MRISFDLDDTLSVSEDKFKIEPALRFPFNIIFKERLRMGRKVKMEICFIL